MYRHQNSVAFVLYGLLAFCLAPSLSADVISGSTNTSGSVDFQYTWDNCAASTAVCSYGGTQETVQVPFSFTIGLPSAPLASLTDATLALSLPSDSGAASITGETSTAASTYLANQYSVCDFSIFGGCLASTYYATYSNQNYAPNLTFDGSATAYVDSITSSGASWSGTPTNATSLNLESLGFGADLLQGGDLTVSGYLLLTAPSVFPTINNTSGSYSSQYQDSFYSSSNVFGIIPTGSADEVFTETDNSFDTGFNANTNFDLQYSATETEGGTLTLDYGSGSPSSVPEPSSFALSAGALLAMALARFRKRRA